jgi:hypothetical protein
MSSHPTDSTRIPPIQVSEEVITYIQKRGCDFRICTSCGGPILLPVSMKRPKHTDFSLKAGTHTIYVSVHQARYLHSIDMTMVPLFLDPSRETRPRYDV